MKNIILICIGFLILRNLKSIERSLRAIKKVLRHDQRSISKALERKDALI